MKLRQLSTYLGLLALAAAGTASAIVISGSNLGTLGYPSPACQRPLRPLAPAGFDGRAEFEAQQRGSEAYLFNLGLYRQCVSRYLKNADNDIAQIQRKRQRLLEDARLAGL